jgi:hypothetical protein
MKKKPVIIKVSRWYAAVFYVPAFIASVITLVPRRGDSIAIGSILIGSITAALTGFGIFSLFSRRFRYDPNSKEPDEPIVTVTEEEIICSYPTQRKVETVRWDNLVKIEVLTTGDGPALCDVYIVLRDADGKGVVIPQECEESKVIVDRILKFPDFDYEKFITAMGSAENRRFVVWEKEDTKSAD